MSQTKSKSTSTSNLSNKTGDSQSSLLFGRKNYMYLLVGIFIIIFGFILMTGGSMPSDEVWDETIIYSFRRITLAPIVILAGLFVSGMAIFVKK
ncbi:MAG: DUF3098 domain-containing protein [Saprospiraceae bacterium]